MKRILRIGKLKEECVDEYRRLHDNIWPELVKEYRENGMSEISCFLNKTDLYVFLQYEESVWKNVDKTDLPVDKKWQELMKTLSIAEPEDVQPVEIFRWCALM